MNSGFNYIRNLSKRLNFDVSKQMQFFQDTQCFDPLFILTLDQEYDANKNDNYVFLYLFITSQTTMIRKNCLQSSSGKWTVFLLNLIHDTTR